MKNKAKYINISKLDAAKRQLEFSIKLFLRNSDIVVIHTLIGAAHGILTDLAKKQSCETILGEDGVRNFIKKEKQNEIFKKLSEAKSFFKHADRDDDKLLKFYISQTEFFIFDTCNIYNDLTKENIPIIKVFRIWFFTKYPNVLKDDARKSVFEKLSKGISPENRAQFLNMLATIESEYLDNP